MYFGASLILTSCQLFILCQNSAISAKRVCFMSCLQQVRFQLLITFLLNPTSKELNDCNLYSFKNNTCIGQHSYLTKRRPGVRFLIFNLGSFFAKFACSLCAYVGFVQVLQFPLINKKSTLGCLYFKSIQFNTKIF